MSANGEQQNKEMKISPTAIILIVIFLIFGLGPAFIPLAIAAAAVYIVYKSKKEAQNGGTSSIEALKEKGIRFMQKMDEMEESGKRPSLSGLFGDSPSKTADRRGTEARAHMEAKFESARKRQSSRKQPDGDTLFSMLSRSEKQHFDSLESDFHDEYLHRYNELKDLLSAGIIEQDEYKDRMVLLKNEFHR